MYWLLELFFSISLKFFSFSLALAVSILIFFFFGSLTANKEWAAWKKFASDFEKRQAAYYSNNKSDYLLHLQ